MLHRHERIAFFGVTHFVTTVTQIRGFWFVDEKVCTRILKLFERCRAERELDCLGYVLMPDHMHALLYQAKDGPEVCDFMEVFKKQSSRYQHPPDYAYDLLWRRRYDDVPLPGIKAIVRRIRYMHNNPVKRGLVATPEEYPLSSAREFAELEKGIITLRRW